LELLALLPDQVQAADVVMQARKGLEEALRASLPQVLAVMLGSLDRGVCEPNSSFHAALLDVRS
jgi:hypothetical protein